MSEGRSKRHHHVPKTLQRRFVSPTGKLFFAKREQIDRPFSPIEERTPRSCFWERNRNTILDPTDTKSDLAEKVYGQIDVALGDFLNDVFEMLARRRIPVFGAAATERIRDLIAYLHKRSIDIAPSEIDELTGAQIIQSTLEDARGHPDLCSADLSEQDFPPPKDLGRSVRVRAQLSDIQEFRERTTDYIATLVQPAKRKGFILGSRMVYRITNKTGEPLGSPNCEVWFPISPSMAVVLIHKELRAPSMNNLPDWQVRDVNEYIVRECLQIGSHSNQLLRSLLKRKA